MGGRKTNLDRTLRVRYKKRIGNGSKIHSSLCFSSSHKNTRKNFKGGRILAVSKVSREERLKIGEHSNLSQILDEGASLNHAFKAQHEKQRNSAKRLRLLMDRLQ